ncbi:hypothetical protein COOONC_09357 [Cooperia oncophora]
MDSLRKQVDRVRENVSAAKEEMKGYQEFKRETAQKTEQYAEEEENLCKMEDELQADERKLSAEKMKLRDEEKRIEQIMESRVRILENMRSNMADEAWRWYQANRDRFRHPLHQVPIGSARSNEYYDEIKSAFANTPYKLYLTDRYRVQFTVSKYGSHEVIGQQSELRSPAQYFVAHTSVTLMTRPDLKRSDNSFELELEMLSTNRPNIDQARAALQETKALASKEVHETAMKILKKLEKLRKICVEESLLRLALRSLREALSKVDEQLHTIEQKMQEDVALMEGRLTVFRSAKEDLRRASENLFEYCGLKTLDESKMSAEEKKIPKMLAAVRSVS